MDRIKLQNNHSFYVANVNDYPQCIEWAEVTAMQKYKSIIDTWQKRTDAKRFTNIFLGDLAKNIVKSFILENRPQYEKFVFEYDKDVAEYNTDEPKKFKQNEEYDLKISNNNEKEWKIEVKSSAEKISNDPSSFLNKRRIIINKKNCHEHFEDFLIQVFFVPENLDFFKNENINEVDNIVSFAKVYVNAFKKQNIKAYIAGLADKEMQKKCQEEFSVTNKYADANTREYANLLIKDTYSPEKLLEFMDNELANFN